MTLFTRDSNGLAIRVDPDHVFRKGDRVRVLLETNTDGYLYIFNQTNDGPVVMIYPTRTSTKPETTSRPTYRGRFLQPQRLTNGFAGWCSTRIPATSACFSC